MRSRSEQNGVSPSGPAGKPAGFGLFLEVVIRGNASMDDLTGGFWQIAEFAKLRGMPGLLPPVGTDICCFAAFPQAAAHLAAQQTPGRDDSDAG